MKLPDLISTGWTEIRSHKMRSFLSFFAIAIGIATFFYTLSVLSQRYRDIHRSAVISGIGRIDVTTEHPLDMTQYHTLKEMLPEHTSLSFAPRSFYYEEFAYKNKLVSGFTYGGIMPTWKDSSFAYRLEGRFINWQDIANKNRVALLTVYPNEKEKRDLDEYVWNDENDLEKKIKMTELTSRVNLLNQQIMLNNETFTVIGLLHALENKKDPRFPQDREWTPRVYMPYTTFYDIQPGWREEFTTSIRIVTGNENSTRVAASALTSFLRSQFGIDEKPQPEFFREKIEKRIKDARADLNKMLFLGLIAMIAGGIGIMNVTMAVIFSRTKEIGVRRALGATRGDILAQFLVEAMLLGLCGSLAGMLLGYLAVLHMAADTSQMTFSWWVVALSILISLVTSFLFALYPAWQASKLRPVDALKYE
ncbi:MAG: ABC transporter permease [Elusimicrobiaceae bacterium]|nr:ABC transporter permease [Elusimicrobiaceae bacterium]